jgi:hypothetical protein
VGPPLAAPPWCENTPELVSVPVSSCDFPSMFYFGLYNPPVSPRSVYHFLVMFCFEMFLSGVDLKFWEHHGLFKRRQGQKAQGG